MQMDVVKKKETKIELYDKTNPQKYTDLNNFDFVSETVKYEKVKFASLLTSELVLRGMPPMINIPRVESRGL